MSRKVTVSFSLPQNTIDWLDQQNEQNSTIARNAIKQYREGNNE